MPPGSADLGVFDLTFGVMRPTTFAPGGFAFVARFFAGFLTGFGFFFAHFVIGVFAFNDACSALQLPRERLPCRGRNRGAARSPSRRALPAYPFAVRFAMFIWISIRHTTNLAWGTHDNVGDTFKGDTTRKRPINTGETW